MFTLLFFEKLQKEFLVSLTQAVQSVDGHGLKGPSHHGILLQYLIKIVHGERIQATVGLRSYARRTTTPRQQTDL